MKTFLKVLSYAIFLNLFVEVLEVFSENNLAYDMSYYNLTALTKKDSVVVENKWKHISIWKRQNNGGWKISRIIFNNR